MSRTKPSSKQNDHQPAYHEPLASGSGDLDIEIDEKCWDMWDRVLKRMQKRKAPVNLSNLLLYREIPDPLRGKLWALLVADQETKRTQELYNDCLNKEIPARITDLISIDIQRTFPGHDMFKEEDGLGQSSLYRISKAYAGYDEEVGYQQGMSFIGAVLLLHMPEEEAFEVLVKIMYEYGIRELYRAEMKALRIKFYQLERLVKELHPDLSSHLKKEQIETQMFASQWFLTLFASKFPLRFVYRVMDLFLCEGLDFLLRISFALLKDNRGSLLAGSFEDILAFFRVHLPKKYNDASLNRLLQMVEGIQITGRLLLRYEKDYAITVLVPSLPPVQKSVSLPIKTTLKKEESMTGEHQQLREKIKLLEEELGKKTEQLEEKQRELDKEKENAQHLTITLKQTQDLLSIKIDQSTLLQEQILSLDSSLRASLDAVLLEKDREALERKLFEKEIERLMAEVQQLHLRPSHEESQKEYVRQQVFQVCRLLSNLTEHSQQPSPELERAITSLNSILSSGYLTTDSEEEAEVKTGGRSNLISHDNSKGLSTGSPLQSWFRFIRYNSPR